MPKTDAETPIADILLATDLSSRCDRATERAIQLAQAWKAKLHVVTAVEEDFRQPSWRSSSAPVLAQAQVDIAEAVGDRKVDWSAEVVAGAPDDVLDDRAREIGADLIVTGAARNELLGRMTPGRSVETMIREAEAPVLVVKRRPSKPYARIFAPTDFSSLAEAALVRAAALWPEAEFHQLHAYRVPFAGFLSEEAHQGEARDAALKEQAEFVARLEARTGRKGAFRSLVEYGESDQLVHDYAVSAQPDLMVLGGHDHGGFLGWLFPDVAGRLLMSVNCDVLVVTEARAKALRSQEA